MKPRLYEKYVSEVRPALQNAASVAGLLLTTEVLIAELPQKAEAPMPGGDHHDGGMGGMM